MGDSTGDADVIASGREPRERTRHAPGLAWLLVGALAAALAVAVTVAVHYRAEAGRPRPGALPAPSRAAALPLPQVTSTALRLPARGGVAGTVVITAAAGRAQFTVSAVITGGTPGTVYDLIGNDCSDVSPLPDKVWATGLAGADGTADLIGYAWTDAVADRYWMTLDPAPGHQPGLHGRFARGQAASPAGQGPCAWTR